ncbi:hypothetical protein CTI12_AA078250 [Artemisia annua]|uniref:Uncharacterized protein n=1 Tax=Artemisia annua TaxID=35608 RepID=A0A2U1Q3T8_ARTAN|nr:hypothetical protein CTI12_AA078250 [Artemisia annua]
MDKENMLCFPHDFPYEFSHDTGITHRAPHSASFQQPLFKFKEESFFSSSPDSALLGWSSPSVNSDEDYWNLIYAAASEVARMKMKMKMNNNFPGQRGYSGDRRLVNGHSAWGPPPVKRNVTTVKRECAGTGVFLPRPPPAQACSPANLPPRMIQSSNKSFVPVTTRPEVEAHMNGGFVSHYEMLISRRNALILAAQQQRRSSVNHSIMESPMNNNNPEVLLPQEWTY